MDISGKTRVYALIGNPVEHSLSPCIQNTAFQSLGLNSIYVVFQVTREELEAAIQGVRSLKIAGLNVTMPLKVDIIRSLDQLNITAKRVGAVNTIHNDEGTLTGYNTDGKGALMALKINKESTVNKKIVILGAGGVSRAVSYSLAGEAHEVVILNRTVGKAERLATELSKTFGNKFRCGKLSRRSIGEALKDAELLINATSLGMRPNDAISPVHKSLLRRNLTVFDLVYDPPMTRLLREARSAGAKIIEGLSMLIYQGAASFELWTGKRAPVDAMMKAARSKLEKRSIV